MEQLPRAGGVPQQLPLFQTECSQSRSNSRGGRSYEDETKYSSWAVIYKTSTVIPQLPCDGNSLPLSPVGCTEDRFWICQDVLVGSFPNLRAPGAAALSVCHLPHLYSSSITAQINCVPCRYKYQSMAFQIKEMLVYTCFVWQIVPCCKVCLHCQSWVYRPLVKKGCEAGLFGQIFCSQL